MVIFAALFFVELFSSVVDWITLIWAALVTIIVVFFLPETYTPILLKWKALHLREATSDMRYRAPIELRQEKFWSRMRTALIRPFQILFLEPIVMLLTLYLTIIYVALFGFLTAYPFVFGDVYGLGLGLQGLCFCGLAVGLCLCSLAVPFVYLRYKKGIENSANGDLPPEQRLILPMALAWMIPAGLFWMAWTDYSSVSVWSPLAASVLVGIGILSVFISSYQYVIDAYGIYAASALASFTFVRYMCSGAAVMFAYPMFVNLGNHWALSLLGFLSLVMVPVPFVFFIYGYKIRSYSRFAAHE